MSTGQKWTWSGKKDNYCINKEDRFAFTMTAPAGRTCDTKEVTVPYGEVVATSKDYTFNLNAATK